MSNSLTFSLLSTLSPSEKTALGKYLQSPFFTNKKFLYPLFSQMRKPDSQVAETPETAFSLIFPIGEFDQHKWNKALSDLNGHIENFMTIRHFLSTPDLYQQATIDTFYEKENEVIFQHAVDAVLKASPEKTSPEKTETWWLRFWSRKRAISYPLANRMKLPASILDDLEGDLDTYYYISKLQLACNRVSGAQFLKHTSQREGQQHLLELAKPMASMGKSLLLSQYYNLLRLLLGADMDFDTFFSALKEAGKHLDRRELETIVRFAFNYCIGRHRQGEARAFGWHIELYIWSQAQGAWTEAVSEELFLNMGILA